MSGVFRVWCLSWEDEEAHGKEYPDKPRSDDVLDRFNIGDGPKWATDSEDAVCMYAEYCFRNRDGWDCTWPLMFRVRCPDGSILDYEVDREYEPTFIARERQERDAVVQGR